MFLHVLAAGLVFLMGLGGLRLAVARESWGLLVLALGLAAAGLMWLVLGGIDAHRAPRSGRSRS